MMSRFNGRILAELEHIKQSIQDILTTPLGSRIMRRDYGSIIADLIDQPVTDVLILKLYSAIYTPITRWEDRIIIEQITISELAAGSLILDIEAVYLLTDQKINLNIPLQMGAAA
ncbi:baseplate assembly protein [Acinetobacter qingfengensis]|uniref:Baseplate assembly protein n=1 Tax=Acinetobacter qingfengensis TaxID=1262585 RepID=A0A1E7RCH3_9GAMM|nr:GPW/gp25 family protein [Acinetobacter qingfengensis]KAA8734915.1 baseplate assembly protein [Acinetobacter qingfengensis]OEY96917.1 baseplate assembly protein [Acinetobacter qingfengensis]